MKNYIENFYIKEKGFIEVPLEKYTECECKHRDYINGTLRNSLIQANCGWDDLQYKIVTDIRMSYHRAFMVLYSNGTPCRWIPISGNSDGCNLQVLGENIW